MHLYLAPFTVHNVSEIHQCSFVNQQFIFRAEHYSILCMYKKLYIHSHLFFFSLFIYLFMAVLGLCFCARAFSSCGKRGPLFIAVRGPPLTIAASLVAEHRLQTRRLSNCGSRAQLLRGMWDLPRPGLEPVSPALAGRFSTTAPPGKPLIHILMDIGLFQIFFLVQMTLHECTQVMHIYVFICGHIPNNEIAG